MPPEPPPVRLGYSEPILTAIGGAITAWGEMEPAFDNLLELLRVDAEVKKIEAVLPLFFKKRAALLIASASVAFPNCLLLRKRLIRIANDAMKLRQFRDFLAHGQYCQIENSDRFTALLIRGFHDVTIKEQEFTIQSILDLRESIEKLHGRILIFYLPIIPKNYFSLSELLSLIEFRQRNPDPRSV